MVIVNFINKDGSITTIDAKEGLSVMEVGKRAGLDIEGACEASLACSTCHVIIDSMYFNKLKKASDEEEDMLDLAFGLTPHSRLSCQVILTKELDGITVRLPSATRNLLLD